MQNTCAQCSLPIEGSIGTKDHLSFHAPKCLDLYTLRLRLMRKFCREPDQNEILGYYHYVETWGRVPSLEELQGLPLPSLTAA